MINSDNNKEHSLLKRYLSRLFSQFISLVIGLLTAGIIPRALGPAYYGIYNFSTELMNNIRNFIEAGSSFGFFSRLSQKPEDKNFISFYAYLSIIVFIIQLIFSLVIYITPLRNTIFKDITLNILFLAYIFSVFTFIRDILIKIFDSYKYTVYFEFSQIVIKVIYTIALLITFTLNILNIFTVFTLQYLNFMISFIILLYILKKKNFTFSRENLKISKTQFKEYSNYIITYTYPLLLYSLVSLIVVSFDRIILQKFGGSVEQGYYSLSYMIGGVIFIFTSSLTSLIIREFSAAHGNNDYNRIKIIFRKTIPTLYAVVAYFAAFTSIFSDTVVNFFGGNNFKDAIIVTSIMAFYPMHQTYGQLSCSVFIATGDTKRYRDIGVFVSILSLIAAYFFIAPKSMFGLELKSIGLALKMVIVQFFSVNIYLYFNCKLLNMSFIKYILHQIITPTIFCIIAIILRIIMTKFITNSYVLLFSAGFVYTIIVFILFLINPMIFAVKREDYDRYKALIFEKIKSSGK